MPRRTAHTPGRLRIIAGAARGRRLSVPPGRSVRPTPDRVREALFSILGARCQGARVVDVCAGTGALGLEALSRGAGSVILVERDLEVAAVLRENVERLRLEGAQVVVSDAVVALCRLGQEGDRLDLVLVDPPYEAGLYRPIAEVIVESRLLAPDGLVVMEHPAATPLDVAGLKLVEQRRYGSVALDLLEPE